MDRQAPYSALRRLAQQASKGVEEHCDLCGEAIGPEHQHLLDLSARQVQCACRACALLFDLPAAGAGVRRLIPNRYLFLDGFEMTDAEWESLHVPVNMAFFAYNTPAERVIALYPSPAGSTESLLAFETWETLERRNPILKKMEPDVEALLVNRVRERREYFIVPIDECYELVGIIRTQWRGFSGGREVWAAIDAFFARLKERSAPRPKSDVIPIWRMPIETAGDDA